MTEDQTLLREYVERGSEAAFATLVERHVNLVYSAALRQVRSPDLARDVVQQVFTDLARKAPSCLTGVIIAGWLHRATVYAASRLIRTEIRRKAREQEALNMIDPVPADDWQQIGPILDSALEQLSARDRDALLLRFFEERSLKELGHMIGLGEEAARKRVSRALEKLRGLLLKQGISTSAVALSSALGTHAVEVAPAGLGQGLAGITAAAGKATMIGNALTLWKGMFMTKMQMAALSSVLALGIAVPLVLQYRTIGHLKQANSNLQKQIAEMALLEEKNRMLRQAASQPTDDARQREVLRLRAEAAKARQLGDELEKLRAQNGGATQKPDAKSRQSKPGEWQMGEMKSREDLANAGFTAPESTVQTLLWAMVNGNPESYLRALKPPPDAPMPTTEQLREAVAAATRSFATVVGIRLDSAKELNDQEVFVKITLLRSNASQTPDSFVVSRDGAEWKIAGGPAGEEASPLQAPVPVQAAANP